MIPPSILNQNNEIPVSNFPSKIQYNIESRYSVCSDGEEVGWGGCGVYITHFAPLDVLISAKVCTDAKPVARSSQRRVAFALLRYRMFKLDATFHLIS